MASGSADPPPLERAQEQRYGVLELLRLRKDDGRALILYSHDEPAAPNDDADDLAEDRAEPEPRAEREQT